MIISSINSFTNNINPSFQKTAVPYPEYQRQQVPSFTHTAVPYPEYQNFDYDTNKGIIAEIADKLSALFHPAVQKEAAEIKADIDSIYETNNNSDEKDLASQRLLSVLA